MKSSIRTKLFSTFIIILLLTEIGLVLLSNLFLDDLSIYGNKVHIKNIYEEYKPYFRVDEINIEKLRNISSENAVGIVIYDNGMIEACSSLFICTDENPTVPSYITNKLEMISDNKGVAFPFNYNTMDVHQFVYIFNIGDGRYVIVDKPLTPIQDINQVIRPFIYIIGILFFLLGSVMIFFTSKRISKPIIEISDYANDLAKLKFDEKLQINQKDEIGLLAKNMNLISRKLNDALNELKEDLENEKELDRKRVRFFSSVSHEFKTPLTIIQGYAEGLKNNIVKSKEDIEEYYDIIIEESKKMNRFVVDLLNLSLYESDNFILNKKNFDIVELINKTVDMFKDSMVNKQVEFSIKGLALCKVYADQYRIEQVINNLISNAIKHVEDNGIFKINVIEENNSVKLYFYNNGELINEKDLSNIWSLFYKIDNSKNKIGTGIGLAIVKSIIELHDGAYGVENKDDGVEFFVEIPK